MNLNADVMGKVVVFQECRAGFRGRPHANGIRNNLLLGITASNAQCGG